MPESGANVTGAGTRPARRCKCCERLIARPAQPPILLLPSGKGRSRLRSGAGWAPRDAPSFKLSVPKSISLPAPQAPPSPPLPSPPSRSFACSLATAYTAATLPTGRAHQRARRRHTCGRAVAGAAACRCLAERGAWQTGTSLGPSGLAAPYSIPGTGASSRIGSCLTNNESACEGSCCCAAGQSDQGGGRKGRKGRRKEHG